MEQQQLTIMTCVSRATTAAYSAAAPRGPPPKRLGSARVGARAHRVSVLHPREGVRARAGALVMFVNKIQLRNRIPEMLTRESMT